VAENKESRLQKVVKSPYRIGNIGDIPGLIVRSEGVRCERLVLAELTRAGRGRRGGAAAVIMYYYTSNC
jgi:hypothetical protein